ncbi:MAG: DUF4157 domain-containing protein [Myxococcales bacterium]|nr:DUF4157 domain-containing protein [Myxococcales bacterium]
MASAQSLIGNRAVAALLAEQAREEPLAVTDPSSAVEREASAVVEGRNGAKANGFLPVGARALHPAVAALVRSARGPGFAPPPSLRRSLEAEVEGDLGGLRLHTDGAASLAAAALDARAFTWGRDVYFGASEYQPNDHRGRSLLTHEAAHVAQAQATPAAQAVVARQPRGAEEPFRRWTGFVATKEDPLMVRTHPDPESEARGKLPKGSEVEVVGGHPKTWLLVNGVTTTGTRIEKGWVLGRLIQPKTAATAAPPQAKPSADAKPSAAPPPSPVDEETEALSRAMTWAGDVESAMEPDLYGSVDYKSAFYLLAALGLPDLLRVVERLRGRKLDEKLRANLVQADRTEQIRLGVALDLVRYVATGGSILEEDALILGKAIAALSTADQAVCVEYVLGALSTTMGGVAAEGAAALLRAEDVDPMSASAPTFPPGPWAPPGDQPIPYITSATKPTSRSPRSMLPSTQGTSCAPTSSRCRPSSRSSSTSDTTPRPTT